MLKKVFPLIILIFMLAKDSLQAQHCKRADSLMMIQEYLLALKEYELCFQADTTNLTSRENLANCLFLLGDYQAARLHYHTLENDSSYYHLAISKLASIYETQQNLPKAIRYNLALRKLYPGNPAYLRKLGHLYLQGNETTQALESFREALLLNPRDLLSIQGMAEMMMSLDELNACDSLVRHGLEVDSMHIGLSLLSARVRFRLKDYSAVAGILNRMNTLTDLNNYYHKLLGYAWMQTDSLDKAIFHLRRSLLNESNPEYALYYLGLAYEKMKDYERSDYYYNEALKVGVSDNISNYYRGLARNSTNNKRLKDAIHHYTECLRYSQDPEILFYLGSLSEQYYKDKTKAVRWYEKYLNHKSRDKYNAVIAQQRIKYLNEQKFMKSGAKK